MARNVHRSFPSNPYIYLLIAEKGVCTLLTSRRIAGEGEELGIDERLALAGSDALGCGTLALRELDTAVRAAVEVGNRFLDYLAKRVPAAILARAEITPSTN